MLFCSCSEEQKIPANPFFEDSWETPYGIPPFDRIVNEHFKQAFEEGMKRHLAEIDSIVNSEDKPTFDNVILAYDNSGKMLSRVDLVFGMLNAANTDTQMQQISEEVMPQLAAHYDAILMNEQLFNKIEQVYNARNTLKLDAEQLRLVEKIYDQFIRSGARLSDSLKSELKQINSELSLLQVKFGNNLLAENNAFKLTLQANQLGGLPNTVRDAAAEQAKAEGLENGYVFTLDKPSMLPFLTYSQERGLREKIYKAYISRGNNGNANDNKAVVKRMAELRREKAKILGYNNYAEYVISDQMASTPEAAYELLEGIWPDALKAAKSELNDMLPMFLSDNGTDATFEPWDWWYYAEKVRVKNYSLEESKVREYLTLDNVKSGIFSLANRLYGITFRPVTVPLYHEEVEAYEVIDDNDAFLGVLLFDFHPREGKSGGAWCGSYVPQSYDENGMRVTPVVSIVCNFTRPTATTPALLSIDETETLFHEFGHALHALFADVKYQGLADVEGDFVELPSQIMENWAFTSAMLKQYAVHYRSGDVMPSDMIRRIHRSSSFNEGFAMTELLAAALSDLEIHSISTDKEIDITEFERSVLNDKRGLIPQISPRYHYTYFSHIFDGGYSAGYYFYIWAEVLDKDAFQAFVESGDLFNREIAQRFRDEVLSCGGTRNGMDMYRAFRGAEPDKRALLLARGFIRDADLDDLIMPDSLDEIEIPRVDTREKARQIAEESRRRRAEESAKREAEQRANAPQAIEVGSKEVGAIPETAVLIDEVPAEDVAVDGGEEVAVATEATAPMEKDLSQLEGVDAEPVGKIEQ